ncbi:MAG: sigma-54-dependent Fis family transcriptional regulator [Myxococcales bacterium]|nr:sigma-54-dependent Fis family transcriptional regulator [Myxococcales bacterium]MCB9735348.1 sigma-54-dependent Fis family transcriptional regulator [Deltaproteobacteria bacterium]
MGAGDAIARERDFLLRLLELGQADDVARALEGALTLMIEISGAKRGYLEVGVPSAGDGAPPAWSRVHAFADDEVAAVKDKLSRGIIAAAMARGETIETASAMLDPRFEEQDSVRGHRIEAVLCAPIGAPVPFGALYLQGRGNGTPFGPENRRFAELFARHAAPIFERLVTAYRAQLATDPTAAARARLNGAEQLIGRSDALAALLDEVALVAPLDVTVLITGPSGTGKSAVAGVIAANGSRRGRPFVELNCAALPDELLESELFGAAQGAHSTANRRIPGKVEAAEGGTLFLDEVGELSLRAQAKLLQLLQDGTYYPLGSSRAQRADVRVISATNVDLAARVAAKAFREDLYYRLVVMELRVPPLDARREDIVPLAEHFCARACAKHRLPTVTLGETARMMLLSSAWPGHVRQLAHAVEGAVIRAVGARSEVVAPAHFGPTAAAPGADNGEPMTFQAATRRFQATLVADALRATDWNVSQTADNLGLARSHVYNLIRSFGLERE